MILTLSSDTLRLVFAFCNTINDLNATAATCSRIRNETLAFKTLKVQEKISLIYGDVRTPCDQKEMLNWFSVLHAKKIMLVGGDSNPRRSLLFKPKLESFARRCAVGIKRTTDFEAVFYAGLLLVVSGSDGPSVGSVECYDFLLNSWSEMPGLPAALVAVACAKSGKHLYLTGGQDRVNRMRVTSVYTLGTGTDTGCAVPRWELLGVQLKKGRSHHGCVHYQGSLWVAGGFVEDSLQATDSVETVTIECREAAVQARMVRKRLRPRLIVIQGVLYAVGGDMNNFYHTASTIEKYDTASQTWQMLTEFPMTRPGCAVAALDNRIFVFGGGSSQSLAQGSWDIFDTATSEWESSRIGFNIPFLTYKDGFREWIKDSLAVTIDFDDG